MVQDIGFAGMEWIFKISKMHHLMNEIKIFKFGFKELEQCLNDISQYHLFWVSLCWVSHFIYYHAEYRYAECNYAVGRYAKSHSALTTFSRVISLMNEGSG
jgi:hypothetical protein